MANLLTIVRIIGTIPLVILIYLDGPNIDSFILFCVLALTDFFDGYLARKYNKTTKLGNILDGIADKFLMLSVTIVLLIKHVIPYYSLLIFLRDFISIFFVIYLTKTNKSIPKSNIFGKAKTTFQILSIVFALLLGKWTIISIIMFILAILSCICELIYIIKVIKNK